MYRGKTFLRPTFWEDGIRSALCESLAVGESSARQPKAFGTESKGPTVFTPKFLMSQDGAAEGGSISYCKNRNDQLYEGGEKTTKPTGIFRLSPQGETIVLQHFKVYFPPNAQ